MAPDAGAQPGGLNPADGFGPRELLRYRSAQGRWVVAAMILGSSVAGIDCMVVAVAPRPRIPVHVAVRECRLARRAGRRRRAGHHHLRDHHSAWQGRQIAGVRRCRGARRGVLGHLRRHRTAREPSHAPAGDLRPAQFRAANAVTFVVNGALGGFAFVFIPAWRSLPATARWWRARHWCRSPS